MKQQSKTKSWFERNDRPQKPDQFPIRRLQWEALDLREVPANLRKWFPMFCSTKCWEKFLMHQVPHGSFSLPLKSIKMSFSWLLFGELIPVQSLHCKVCYSFFGRVPAYLEDCVASHINHTVTYNVKSNQHSTVWMLSWSYLHIRSFVEL